jgi:hypothetical protein
MLIPIINHVFLVCHQIFIESSKKACFKYTNPFINNKVIRRLNMGYKLFHENFSPSSSSLIEQSYNLLKVTHRPNTGCFLRNLLPVNLIFGITVHASERMKQRDITNNMLAHTIKHGYILKEGPQKRWDGPGRKLFIMDKMIVVTNFDQNRIVTVYWKIDNWSNINTEDKKTQQELVRQQWLNINSNCL